MPTLKPDGRRLNGTGSKWIRRKRRLDIYSRDGWACHWCTTGVRVPDLVDDTLPLATLDHLIPRRLGVAGSNVSEYLVTACKACNDKRNVCQRKRDSLTMRAGRGNGRVWT